MINETNKLELLKNKHYKKILKIVTYSWEYLDDDYLVLNTDNKSNMLLFSDFSIMIESEKDKNINESVEENEPIVKQYKTLLNNKQKFDMRRFDMQIYEHSLFHLSSFERMMFMLAYDKKILTNLQNTIIKKIFKLIPECEFNDTSFSLSTYGESEYLIIDSEKLPLMLIQIKNY